MIGNILLTLALLTGVLTIIMYYFTFRGYSNTISLARIGYHITAILVLAASALLLHAILTHQYQYAYIYNYSSSDLPVGLLMATFWAGQEGSFMLWVFFTAIIGLILLDYTSKRGDLEQRVMMIFTLALSFLLVMVNPLLKSPFNFIWLQNDFIDVKNINQAFLSLPALQNFFFSDPGSNKQFVQMGRELYAALTANNISMNDFIIQGKGLNPLLQNFWMQIHPPVLFVGFAMAAVPFSFAMAAIMKNEYRDWVKQALPWVLSTAMVLGLAIMLGGYWAYGVLGWGGYWGWDPVENSSLVPWLIGVASIHTLLVQKKTQERESASFDKTDTIKTGRFVKTNLLLSILTYVLVLYSTFLTRSGILGDASVHSFVDPGMTVYLFLVIFLGAFAILGIGGILYRWKYLTEQFTFEENVLSRELALFTGSVALIASAIIVLVGTSAPIFGHTVELKFYNELNLPIAIIIGLLNGLSFLLKWHATNKKQLWKESQFSLIASFVLTALIVFIGGVHELMYIILTFSAVFTLFVNGEIAINIFRGRKSFLGGYIAHAGLAIFLLGALAEGAYSQKQHAELVKNEKLNVLGHALTFIGYEPFDNGKKYKFNIKVESGSSSSIVSPVMFVSEFNNSLMREPDYLKGLTKDFYVSPVGYDEGKTSGSETPISLKKGEKYDYNGVEIIFNQFALPKDMSGMTGGAKFKIGVDLTVKYNGKEEKIEPYMENDGQGPVYVPAELPSANLRVTIVSINASNAQVDLLFTSLESNSQNQITAKEVFTVEASIKPFISLVWIGVLIMAFGFVVAVYRRYKESLV